MYAEESLLRVLQGTHMCCTEGPLCNGAAGIMHDPGHPVLETRGDLLVCLYDASAGRLDQSS